MSTAIRVAAVGLVVSLGLVESAVAATCPDDSVASGTVCMDKYEASVWYVPPEQEALIDKIQRGTVTLANLLDAGAVQLGLASGDLAASGCPATGNGCLNVYAVSIPEVMPASFNTWFQAAAAARNSLKRLPTNQEWQVAALGTPDGTPCAVGTAFRNTGNEPGCVSDVGAFDMVGNLSEKVADWGDLANNCTLWPAAFGGDLSCVGGPGSGFSNVPGMLLRGGFTGNLAAAGVFAVNAGFDPSFSASSMGFRCAREGRRGARRDRDGKGRGSRE